MSAKYRGVIFILFFSIPKLAFSGECENWRQNHPEWLWCDDFESNDTNLALRYEDVGLTGLSVVADEFFDGKKCLRQHYDSGQVNAGWVCRVKNEGFPDHIFMRWYHKFENGFEGFPEKMARIRYRNRETWSTVFSVNCWTQTDGVQALDVSAKNSSQAENGWLVLARSNFSFAKKSNIGKWVCFEMEVKVNTSGSKDGLFRLWKDDTLIIEKTGMDLRGGTSDKINEAELDCYWGGGSPKSQNRFYDSYVISTQKIGMANKATPAKESQILPSLKNGMREPHVEIIRGNKSMLPEIKFYSIPGQIVLTIYDLLGRKIKILVDKYFKAEQTHLSLKNLIGPNAIPARGIYILDIKVDGIDAGRSFLHIIN